MLKTERLPMGERNLPGIVDTDLHGFRMPAKGKVRAHFSCEDVQPLATFPITTPSNKDPELGPELQQQASPLLPHSLQGLYSSDSCRMETVSHYPFSVPDIPHKSFWLVKN